MSRLFIIVGAQRTGTTLLGELLNTNRDIAALGEVFSPSPAPSCWYNYVREHGISWPAHTWQDASALVDGWVEFIEYRIRNHWADGDKSECKAIGFDVKYNQLRWFAPSIWDLSSEPFLLYYLKRRRADIVHVVRRNLVHCSISALLAEKRGVWHNYRGETIAGRWHLDVQECLSRARRLALEQRTFASFVDGEAVVECAYEDLIRDISTVDADGRILEGRGPLRAIADLLGVDFQFRNNGRLKKAINAPYATLILNHEELLRAVRDSEFAAFATELE